MENPRQYLLKNICELLSLQEADLENTPRNFRQLLRMHKKKFEGDMSFPRNIDTIFPQFSLQLNELGKNLFNGKDIEQRENAISKLIIASKMWFYPLESIKMQNERCALYLNHTQVIGTMLDMILNTKNSVYSAMATFGQLKKNNLRRVYLRNVTIADSDNMIFYRANVVESALRRVLQFSDWILEENDSDSEPLLRLQVIDVISNNREENYNNWVTIKTGSVNDSMNNKKTSLTTQEYIRLRSNDMRLIAMHKYGMRTREEHDFVEIFNCLGKAAVTVDLLEVKHSSPVHVIRAGQGCTKGAAFIFYNSARLESLLRKFDMLVEKGTYDALPPMNKINFDLLVEDEEWQLVFNYMLGFANMIESCVDQLEIGNCSLNIIVRFLTSFSSLYSTYYKRIKILTNDSADTQLRNARIYLIKAVRLVFNIALSLLGIKPVTFM